MKYFWASICSCQINKHAKQVGDIIVFLFVVESYRSKSINVLSNFRIILRTPWGFLRSFISVKHLFLIFNEDLI